MCLSRCMLNRTAALIRPLLQTQCTRATYMKCALVSSLSDDSTLLLSNIFEWFCVNNSLIFGRNDGATCTFNACFEHNKRPSEKRNICNRAIFQMRQTSNKRSEMVFCFTFLWKLVKFFLNTYIPRHVFRKILFSIVFRLEKIVAI